MRLIFTIVIALIFSFVYAQTDSTESVLKRFRELREKGLITEQEYEALKRKELNLSDVKISKTDTMSMDKLKHRYRSELIGGSVFMAAGIAFIATAIKLKDSIHTDGTVNTRDIERKAVGVCAGLASGVGIFLTIKGAIDRRKYVERISLSPTSASILIRF